MPGAGDTPATTDPAGATPTGADPTGAGSSTPPTTTPAGTTPASGEQETVTIDDGTRSISVSSPDGQGKVTVSVDDGSGEPKTYTLDFGEAGSEEATAGAAAVDPLTGRPVTGGNQENGSQPITPGPDGKCVIRDGDLTITAERPDGSTDTVVVTVDDGTGEPVTYNLDYSGDEGTTPGPTARTLPATEDEPTILPAGIRSGEPTEGRGLYAAGPGEPMRFGPTDPADPADRFATAGQAAPGERTAWQVPGASEPAGRFVPVGPVEQPAAFGPAGWQAAGDPANLGQPVPSDPSDPDRYGVTNAQASTPGSGAGSFFGDPDDNAHRAGTFGLPDTGQYAGTPADAPGEAGLASAADGEDTSTRQHEQNATGVPMAGTPAATGPGGTQERPTGTQWRTTGDLFDDVADARVRDVFGEGGR
ncbi:hypothetical protein BU204_37560 [Actinophytocola xanthii]|uniref:Uncharacterized protein n=1 Tax=Actinophytocola xanthii TaxID=1912961 RepID=A0A1Q8BRY3_9PSEU|nr:hypothetical protein BU204_37560 [Actinophytocola xanthii]